MNNDLMTGMSLPVPISPNRNKKLYDDKPTPIWPYQSEADFAYRQQRGLML